MLNAALPMMAKRASDTSFGGRLLLRLLLPAFIAILIAAPARASDTLISNVVYWRPPGNRAPTQAEIAVCRPFVERLIELTNPAAIMLAGGVPMQALLGVTGIMRARGAWRDLTLASGAQFPALPVFHPAFLLRQPAQKRLAWADLQTLAARLRDA